MDYKTRWTASFDFGISAVTALGDVIVLLWMALDGAGGDSKHESFLAFLLVSSRGSSLLIIHGRHRSE